MSRRRAASAPLPVERRANDRVEVGRMRLPVQASPRERRISDELGRVARTPRRLPKRYRTAGDPLDGGDDLSHRAAMAGAEVHRAVLSARAEIAERAYMRVAQIGDVDVIADGSPVGGRIIGAVDLDRLAGAERRTQYPRDQVGFRVVILPDLALGIGASGIEIAQGRKTEPVSAGIPIQCPLDGELCLAIGVE